MTSTTTIGLERVGAAAILAIGGDVTSASEAALMDRFTEAIDGGAKTVLLDFAGMDYMNSGGIGLLVTLLVRAQRGAIRLAATGLSDHYRQILSLTRIDEAIAIHPDTAAALAAVGS